MILPKKLLFLFILSLALPFQASSSTLEVNRIHQSQEMNLPKLSADFLTAILKKEDYRSFQNELNRLDSAKMHLYLDNDQKKLSFWINLYNAYIILALRAHPEYYEPEVRSAFFKKKLIEVAGMNLSFAEVEHGLVRKSQWEYGLGYFRSWFPSKFERQNRVEKRDYRIHFALNCGAKDCPPVVVYTPNTLKEQFSTQTRNYLERTTVYTESNNTVEVTSLFNWFRGDFGGKGGTRDILRDYGLIPENSKPDLSYLSYDWTLELNNYFLPK